MIGGVLITGGSGLIGRRLTTVSRTQGINVHHLSRLPADGSSVFYWDPDKGELDEACFNGVDTIVHLAGENVASGRWTQKRKRRILSSRVLGARLLFDHLARHNKGIKTFITSSGSGYYGFYPTDSPITEASAPGTDFLAQVCKEWEGEAARFESFGTRVASVRTGLVLAGEGGALPALMRPVRWGLGSPLGTGNQLYSWIHIDDLCRLYLHIINTPQLSGAFNGAASSATNKEFLSVIAEKLKRPLWLPPIPAWTMKLLLGEMAGMVLGGGRLSTEKVLATEFKFQYPNLRLALDNLIR